MSAGDERELLRVARDLARRAGLGTVASIAPITGGGNNRVYRAHTGSRDLFLKQYFRSGADTRDRFTAEVAFASFVWNRGIRAIAEPLGADRDAQVAAFAWVDGRRIAPGKVGREHVAAAAAFWENLNEHRAHPQAASLGPAAEACFTIAEHLRLVSARVALLTEEADEPARTFAREQLQAAWMSVQGGVHAGARELGIDLQQPVPQRERCLSPSDFGFHNALEADRLIFHDFEYAGWDDPAKLVGDFFSQVAVPVAAEHEPWFTDRVRTTLGLPDSTLARMALLRPVFRLKWCCIVLNEFLPLASRRRAFAAGEDVPAERKADQFGKAEAVLAEIRGRRPNGPTR